MTTKKAKPAPRCKDTVDMFNEGVPYQVSALMAASRVHSERITKLEEWNKAQEARITWYIDRLNEAESRLDANAQVEKNHSAVLYAVKHQVEHMAEGMKTLSDRLDSCEADQHPVKPDRAPRELSINESRTVELLDYILSLDGPQEDLGWCRAIFKHGIQSQVRRLRTQIVGE